MIGYLSGRVLDVIEGKVTLGVGGEGGSVGYLLSVPTVETYACLLVGQKMEFFVHTHVREDALDLYGFATPNERELFLALLQVNGIGPKGALGVLSRGPIEQIVRAVLDKDKNALTAIPGIGKKTAERIVVDLGDSLVKKSQIPGNWVARLISSAPASTLSAESRALNDAKAALVSLGYPEMRVSQVLKQLYTADDPTLTAEKLIRVGLKALG